MRMRTTRDTVKTAHRRPQSIETISYSKRQSFVTLGTVKKMRAFRRLFVEVTEKPFSPTEISASPRRIFEQLSALHVKCSGPDCRDGGIFLLPTIIQDMLQNQETERLLMEMCPGRVPSASNKPMHVRCQNMFCIRILLV